MQAVYSTATDVKIHKAIRHEWASFQVWLFNQRKRLERREHQILSAAQRKWGQLKKTDKQEIVALQQELLVVARRQWLARVRQRQLHLEHWVMTPEEKHMLQQMLGWTQREMIDAYAREQAEMGPMYQRVDPTTLGTRDSGPSHLLNSPSRFMHPPERTGIPAYTNWASELAKMSAASSHKPQPQPSIKSVELPSMPLYFVGALLQGADLDAVAAADLEAFALHASEEKIREYYFDACEASVHFQRILATINPSQRDAAQQEFERRMRDLASAKEREWKAMAVKALRQHQATEMEHRAAQQRAMRSPPRRPRRRDLSDWDYLEEYHSPRRDPDYSSTYQSSQQDYVEAYQSPREDYLDPYHSLLSPPDLVEAYNSPRPRRKNQRPVVEEDYVVSPSVDDFPRLRRRNALHRVEEEFDDYALSPREPYETRALYQEEPLETGLLSGLTKWISKLGAFLPGRKRRDGDSTSSFDWMESGTNPDQPVDERSKSARKRTLPQETRLQTVQPQNLGTWGDLDEFSEEEFPIRKGKSRWREKFNLSLPKRTRRNRSPTSSDIGWEEDSD